MPNTIAPLTITAETRTELERILDSHPLETLMGFDYDGINAVIFRLFYAGQNGTPEMIELAKRTLAEAGFPVDGEVSRQEIAAVWDAMNGLIEGTDEFRAAQSYAAAVALHANDLASTVIILDGPGGAGFMWDEARSYLD